MTVDKKASLLWLEKTFNLKVEKKLNKSDSYSD